MERLAQGEDFSALAREYSVDESAVNEGLVPYLVRQEHSPLARVVFDAAIGEVVGPVPAAGHHFLCRVEQRRPAISGAWTSLRGPVEDSLRTAPVEESEFLHWKLEMERRYAVDLAPLLERLEVSPRLFEDDSDA